MGLFKMMKAGWQSLTPAEKAKQIIKLVCSMGMGTICGDMANQHMAGKTKLEKLTILTASYGLGCYLGDKSGEAIGEVVDAAVELNNLRKSLKEQEGKENA